MNCEHHTTHTEVIEHDQLPEQMSLVTEELEVCSDCGEVVGGEAVAREELIWQL